MCSPLVRKVQNNKVTAEASLIVPDFYISVYGSSCNNIFSASFSSVAFSYYLKEGQNVKSKKEVAKER